MTSFKANNKAKAKIGNRYKLIAGAFVFLFLSDIAEHLYNKSYNPSRYHKYDLFLLVLFAYLFFKVFVANALKFNRIIQSVELGNDTIKVKTFPFDIKYIPYKRKAIEFETEIGNVIYKKLKLNLSSLVDNLPFDKSHSIIFNMKDYYLVPSLFDEKQIIGETISEHF